MVGEGDGKIRTRPKMGLRADLKMAIVVITV
jgi:hypothetical protein